MTEIAVAFSSRTVPANVVPSTHAATFEYDEASYFIGRNWQSITYEEWHIHSDSIYAFTPLAFCYFLPSILSAVVKENNSDLLVVAALINMLDRSPDVDLWDDFFTDRWTLLTVAECRVVQLWILWLAEQQEYDDDTLTRAYETLEMLVLRCSDDRSCD
ncbi:hypothetical protein [Pseudoduganella dura]|uniref:hypothetical protein n=1 Tax=Pseudoduganella dura TaxID=321982 RepID=UPI0016743372|nr:hypothetical protein [Pseudoduganella dura]GGX96908.1 hypothetical protein GCM10007386_29840 [Pseudoduganella dura]